MSNIISIIKNNTLPGPKRSRSNELYVVLVDGDPSISGVDLPVGSVAIWVDNGVAKKYFKTNSGNTDWSSDVVVESGEAIGDTLSFNGTSWERIPAGAESDLFVAHGNSLLPSWEDAATFIGQFAAGGAGTEFIFRPDEPAPSGTIYADFELLYAAFDALGPVKRTITCDDEFNNVNIPARAGGAKYDFTNTTIIGNNNQPYFIFEDGAKVSVWPLLMQNFDIRSDSTSPVLDLFVDMQTFHNPIYFIDCSIRGNAGVAALWSCAGGGTFFPNTCFMMFNKNNGQNIQGWFADLTDGGGGAMTLFGRGQSRGIVLKADAFVGTPSGPTAIWCDNLDQVEQQTEVEWAGGGLTPFVTNLGTRSFIWRPSEPNPIGNIYSDFYALYKEFNLLGPIPRTIVYDDSLGVGSVPDRGDGLKYDFTNTTIIGMDGYPTFRFADGAKVSQWPTVFQNLDIRTNSTAPVLDLFADPQVVDPLYFIDCSIEGNSGVSALWSTVGGANVQDVVMINRNKNTSHGINSWFLDTTDLTGMRLCLFGMRVGANAFVGNMGGGSLTIKTDSASTVLQQTDLTWSAGVVTQTYFDILPGQTRRKFVRIPTASVATLNATPYTVLSEPVNDFFQIVSVHAWLDFNTVAYDGVAAGENLVLKYTNAAGAALTQEIPGAGFGDSVADAHRIVGPVNTVITPVSGIVVAHLLVGEWFAAAGNSDLVLEILYRDLPLNPVL